MSYAIGDAVFVGTLVDELGGEALVVDVDNGHGDLWYCLEFEDGTRAWRSGAVVFPATIQYDDAVNHPVHYNSDPSGIECIEVVRHRTFNVGAAMKYLWRNGLKDADAQVEDLRKAVWHIEDEIKRLGAEA